MTAGEIERVLEIVFITRRKSARTLRLEIIQALRREFKYDGGRCHACGFWKPARLMMFDSPARIGGRCRLCNARQCRNRRKDRKDRVTMRTTAQVEAAVQQTQHQTHQQINSTERP